MSPAIDEREGRMCFSATGSFAVSGVLTAAGAASVSRNSSKAHRLFAAVPLIFAAQQAAEGTVWLTMTGRHPGLHLLAVSVFLGIALVIWPTWLPLSLALCERRPPRRRVLGALFWAGCAVAAYAALFMARFHPVARTAGHSLRYDYAGSGDTLGEGLSLAAYSVPTVVPFFVSTLRMARTIGSTLVVSLLASALGQRDALTSVWCFFAAVLSGLILVALERERLAGALRGPASPRPSRA
jgi:hypothetical protein